MAKLASLVVDLQLQSAQLRHGLDEANKKLEEFAKQSERTGNVIAGALSFDFLKDALGSLAGFIKSGADAADSMGDLAAAVGVPVEALSKLAYAGAFSAASTEMVGKALSKTADMMAKAADPASEQAAMFRAIGVEAADADGKLRASEAVFADIAQRFAETDDGAGKTALAMRLFGDEGTKLIPLLNNGKAGLAAFAEEAERTGNVITAKGSASAGDFNDALDRLKKASEGLAARVAQDLAPNMMALSETFTVGKGSAEAFDAVAQSLAGTVRVLASAAVLVGAAFESTGEILAGEGSALANLLGGDKAAAGRSADLAGEKLRETFADTGKKLAAIWEEAGPGAVMARDSEKAKPAADSYVAAIDRTKKASEAAAEAQKKLAEAAKKAQEESAKALEDYVKAALALERQHAAIDRAAVARLGVADPTAGFADEGDALSRMAQAQKDAASARDEAGKRDKDGDAIGADAALRRAAELEDLAARASSAADAFRSMEAAAIDTALWMDGQAAALSNQLADIDSAVEARRAAMTASDADPTAGFASFNAALDAMSTALKREATLRAEAAALERAGRLGEARQANLAAEATKALAENASVAADALKSMDEARANVPKDLAGMLKPSGSAINATLEGVKTGASAGTVGAVVGGLVGLLSQSESFQGALSELESIFQRLADTVGLLVEPLLPLLTVVAEVAAGLGALIGALSPIVEFVAQPLFEVLKALGMVVLGLVKFIGEIINGIGELFGFKNKLNLSGIDAAMERLEGSSYEASKETRKLAEAARSATESTSGIPQWWRVELARFNAADPATGAGGARPGAPSGGTTVNDNSKTTINVNGETDPVRVADLVREHLEDKGKRSGGSKFSRRNGGGD